MLTSSEYFCGSGKFERKSFLNRAVISYISSGHSELPSAVKLKDRLHAVPTTSTTTEAPQAVSIEEQDAEEEQEEEEEPEEADEDLSDEVLHVLQDVGVSDALAYVASLLYDVEESRKSSTTIYLDKLPIRSSSKTSAKRARIVSSYPPAAPSPGHGGGRFSCLVEAFQPTCSCGWSRIPRIASPTNEEAVLHEFPPMAGVLTKKHGKVFCGAAISKYTCINMGLLMIIDIEESQRFFDRKCQLKPSKKHTSIFLYDTSVYKIRNKVSP